MKVLLMQYMSRTLETKFLSPPPQKKNPRSVTTEFELCCELEAQVKRQIDIIFDKIGH